MSVAILDSKNMSLADKEVAGLIADASRMNALQFMQEACARIRRVADDVRAETRAACAEQLEAAARYHGDHNADSTDEMNVVDVEEYVASVLREHAAAIRNLS